MRFQNVIGLHRNAGFTLVEAMMVVVILGIISAYAIPGYRDMVARSALRSSSQSMITSLSLARARAVTTTVAVSICPSANGLVCGGSWHQGWIVFSDNNTDGELSPAEEVYFVQQSLPKNLGVVSNFTGDRVTFDRQGNLIAQGIFSFTFCLVPKQIPIAKSVIVTLVGGISGIESNSVSIEQCVASL